MSDRDGLRRRAEVLQKVADQLSAQLRVERWSNQELRKLRGEPPVPSMIEDDRLAARRFVTFASVAVLTAAAVALLVSRPWRGADALVSTPVPAATSWTAGSAVGATIVPFTVVTAEPSGLVPVDVSPVPPKVTPAETDLAFDTDSIFGRPSSRVQLQSCRRARGRASLQIEPIDIFGQCIRGEDDRVP